MLQKVGKSSPADGDDLPLKMCGKPHGFPWFPITMICKWWDFQIYVNLEEGDWMVGSSMLDFPMMVLFDNIYKPPTIRLHLVCPVFEHDATP